MPDDFGLSNTLTSKGSFYSHLPQNATGTENNPTDFYEPIDDISYGLPGSGIESFSGRRGSTEIPHPRTHEYRAETPRGRRSRRAGVIIGNTTIRTTRLAGWSPNRRGTGHYSSSPMSHHPRTVRGLETYRGPKLIPIPQPAHEVPSDAFSFPSIEDRGAGGAGSRKGKGKGKGKGRFTQGMI